MTPGWFHVYYVGQDGQERCWVSAESIPKLLEVVEAAQNDPLPQPEAANADSPGEWSDGGKTWEPTCNAPTAGDKG